jgi:hypothetical protein
VGLAQMTVIVIALVVGLPLVIVGLAAMGLVGWIVAAVVLPIAALAALLRIGREKRPPGTTDDSR